MTDFSIIGKFRNKEQVRVLVNHLREKGKSCYDFTEKPADPNNPTATGDEQMKAFESISDYQDDPYFQGIFKSDLDGLKSANAVILLLQQAPLLTLRQVSPMG